MLLKTKAFMFVSILATWAIIFLYATNQLIIPRKQRLGGNEIINRTNRYLLTLNATTTPTKSKQNVIVILAYTKFFGVINWIKVPSRCPKTRKQENHCPLDNLEVTYDKKRFAESDYVFFHAREMPSIQHLKLLLENRPRNQKWVYHNMEPPNKTPRTTTLNGLFHLTSTYRSDSDILAVYGSYMETANYTKAVPLHDFAAGKSKLVAWVVSNCRSLLRKQFVFQLREYVQVHVFGGCSKEFGKSRSCPHDEDQCESILKKYKFYLSFESVLCEDYITEKYWRHLGEENIVPVVMGGANYSRLAIPGSYIDVMDFKTVRSLAKYLQYLDKNNTAYNEYFKWRQKYRFIKVPLLCEICRVINAETPLKLKVYNDLTNFWFKQGKCGQKNRIIEKMLQ